MQIQANILLEAPCYADLKAVMTSMMLSGYNSTF